MRNPQKKAHLVVGFVVLGQLRDQDEPPVVPVTGTNVTVPTSRPFSVS
jgi:hypothetical protein